MRKVNILKLFFVDFFAALFLVLPTATYDLWQATLTNSLQNSDELFLSLYFRTLVVERLDLYLIPVFAILFTWIAYLCVAREKKVKKIIEVNAIIFCLISLLVYVALLFMDSEFLFYSQLFPVELVTTPPRIISVTIIQFLIAACLLQRKGSKKTNNG
ncbi:MAG: hypothetical protein LBU61_02725 [Coriobacteriales bacterium]|jgi:hypothetical protein|nr:hypothetical protein [Coriobacteriales bacterium]